MEVNNESFTQTSDVDNGREQLDSIRSIIMSLVMDKAGKLSVFTKGRKIALDVVSTALLFVVGDNLYEDVSDHSKMKVKDRLGTQTMERIDMRRCKTLYVPDNNMSDAASIYINEAIDYIMNQITSNATSQTPHGYAMSVKNNRDLSEMFAINNISFVSNTVVPYLSYGLYRKIKTDESDSDMDEEENEHMPKAMNIVKSLQDSGDCIILPRSAMTRIMRGICIEIDSSAKVGMDTPIYLQYIVEQEMIDILRQASYVSYASKSTKLNAVDIDIAISIRENKLPSSFN